MHTEDGQRHLSPNDLAERERVPLATIYSWNRLGTGPKYMRVGRHVRYRHADVVAWENSRYAGQEAPSCP